ADTRTYDFTDSIGVHHELTNHDKFLPDNGFGYPGANGFKTGWTQVADHTLVATAKRNGRQCIAVILGAVDSGYTWAASLLDRCWRQPPVATTGTVLPRVAVSPYASRVAEQAGFTNLAVGTTGTTRPEPAASAPSTKTGLVSSRLAASTAAAVAGGIRVPVTSTIALRQRAHHGGGGLVTPTRLALILVALFGGAIWLRRRAVKRRRARRRARQRARAKAMRSGSLPVVDGRYRTGTRVGPPEESGMRVKRNYIDLTNDDDDASDAGGGRRTDFFGLS
ncbi:MAG TPA: hypothetical protein VK771_10380, partial [Acidimicrobiia bacterium]|nr:hypothetical protein [Acidimicrobiia bacterium]